MNKLYDYLLRFLLNCPERENEIVPQITYASTSLNDKEFANYAIVIRASDFFTTNYGNENSLPSLPLPTIENIPILYGNAKIERQGNTIIIHADLLASTFVLLTRYEEWLQTDLRDEHGRFLAKHSIASKSGFLHRPIVDEYGVLLRKYLRQTGVDVPEPAQKINKIYLTHDVDFLTRYTSFRGFCGAVWRTLKTGKNEITLAIKALRNPQNDPFFSFPWILQHNAELKYPQMETLFFLKSRKYPNHYDHPFYSLRKKVAKQLISLLKKENVTIGLHTSYTATENSALIVKEKQELEKACNTAITCNRNHFLRTKNPADMDFLLKAGIIHDFTLGFADCAGFRLGTCRPVQYINVENKEITNLLLHPLLIMDCSLSDKRYMNLNENEAFEYATRLIEQVKTHNGEAVLLWHNQAFAENEKFNNQELYCKILNYIATIYSNNNI